MRIGQIKTRAAFDLISTVRTSTSIRAVAVVLIVGGDVPSFAGPQMIAQASPTSYPPAPAYVFTAYHQVGDKFRIQVSSSPSFTSTSINDATVTLTGVYATDKAAINAKLAGISSGTSWIRGRVERTSTVYSEWSVPVKHGTASIGTVTSSTDIDVYATFKLSYTLTLSEPSYVDLMGDDRVHFELSGTQPGTSFTMKFLNDVTKSYTLMDDFDTDHIYDVDFLLTGLNGQQGTTQATVEVLYYDVAPDTITMTSTTNADLDTLYTKQTGVITGMASDYDAPVVINGTYQDFRIHNGTSWGSYLTSTLGITMRLGYNLEIRAKSTAVYSDDRIITGSVGETPFSWTITTKADPAGWAVLGMFPKTVDEGFVGTHTIPSVVLRAGKNIILDLPIYPQGSDEIRIGTSSGQSATRLLQTYADDSVHLGMRAWEITMASDYTGNLWVKTVAPQPTVVTVFCPANGALTDQAIRTPGYLGADPSTEVSFNDKSLASGDESDTTVTKSSDGAALFAVGTSTSGATTSSTSSTGVNIGSFNMTTAERFDSSAFIMRIFQMNASGVPKFTIPTTGGEQTGLAVSFAAS